MHADGPEASGMFFPVRWRARASLAGASGRLLLGVWLRVRVGVGVWQARCGMRIARVGGSPRQGREATEAAARRVAARVVVAPGDDRAVHLEGGEGGLGGDDVLDVGGEQLRDAGGVAARERVAPRRHLAVVADRREGVLGRHDVVDGHHAGERVVDVRRVAAVVGHAPRHREAAVGDRGEGLVVADHLGGGGAAQLRVHLREVAARHRVAPWHHLPVLADRGEGVVGGGDARDDARLELRGDLRGVAARLGVAPRVDLARGGARGEGRVARGDVGDRVEAALHVRVLLLRVVQDVGQRVRDGAAAVGPAPRLHRAVLQNGGEGVQRAHDLAYRLLLERRLLRRVGHRAARVAHAPRGAEHSLEVDGGEGDGVGVDLVDVGEVVLHGGRVAAVLALAPRDDAAALADGSEGGVGVRDREHLVQRGALGRLDVAARLVGAPRDHSAVLLDGGKGERVAHHVDDVVVLVHERLRVGEARLAPRDRRVPDRRRRRRRRRRVGRRRRPGRRALRLVGVWVGRVRRLRGRRRGRRVDQARQLVLDRLALADARLQAALALALRLRRLPVARVLQRRDRFRQHRVAALGVVDGEGGAADVRLAELEAREGAVRLEVMRQVDLAVPDADLVSSLGDEGHRGQVVVVHLGHAVRGGAQHRPRVADRVGRARGVGHLDGEEVDRAQLLSTQHGGGEQRQGHRRGSDLHDASVLVREERLRRVGVLVRRDQCRGDAGVYTHQDGDDHEGRHEEAGEQGRLLLGAGGLVDDRVQLMDADLAVLARDRLQLVVNVPLEIGERALTGEVGVEVVDVERRPPLHLFRAEGRLLLGLDVYQLR